MATTADAKTAKVNTGRRNLMIGAGAVALAVLGGIAYFAANRSGDDADARRPAGPISAAELMAAGPLAEQAQGAADAPVTIVEYASATCPHCAHFHLTTFPELKKRYIDTGKVRFVFREFPLDPVATGAFMLARCAGNDRYFALLDLLFHEQRQWAVNNPLPPLFNVVKQAGFTQESFNACLADRQLRDGVEKTGQRAADRFGVRSTPTFFINGNVVRGSFEVEDLDKVIEPYLKG